MSSADNDLRSRLAAAIEREDRPALAALIEADRAAALAVLNEPTKHRPPLLATARSVETAQRLLHLGADPAVVGAWWAPGFRVVTHVDAAVGQFLADLGTSVTPHAAAGLGHTERLARMIAADPGVVHAKGGDGCTPLHFARTVETAALLIAHGADLDARDDDHDSTPSQWLVGDAPEVAAHLLERGATPDAFVAAALGDRPLVARLVDEDPARLALRVGLEPDFPPIGHRGLGGTILQWSLGFNSYAHQYALANGHHELFRFMCERSDAKTRFLVACLTARRDDAERIAAERPGIVETLPDDDLELLACYCWETNADVDAVRLMLDLGWPIDFPETRHAFAPLHNAAWGGYGDLVDLLIARGARVDQRDPEYDSTPLEFAIHCCCREGRHPDGEYTRVVDALISAGCPWDASIYPTGHPKVDAALERHGAATIRIRR